MNGTLTAIEDVNKKIAELNIQNLDTSALQDERNNLIDDIASIIPVRVIKREGDRVAIYAQNGGMLLDGRVYALEFTKAPTLVTAEMTLGAPLGGLMQQQGAMGGPVVIPVGTGSGLMDGGSLAALFEVRDRIAPELNVEMDRYAADIIDRFQTLVPPAALDPEGNGLFVDSNPGAVTGLAGRLAVNAEVDPTQGGAVWKLRDGLSAVTPGPEGFGAYLEGLTTALTEPRDPVGFVSQNAANGSAIMASELASFFAGKSARSDDDRAYLTARQSTLVQSELNATGVNTDSELQALTLVEQTYAANARVLSVIDELMQLLLRI